MRPPAWVLDPPQLKDRKLLRRELNEAHRRLSHAWRQAFGSLIDGTAVQKPICSSRLGEDALTFSLPSHSVSWWLACCRRGEPCDGRVLLRALPGHAGLGGGDQRDLGRGAHGGDAGYPARAHLPGHQLPQVGRSNNTGAFSFNSRRRAAALTMRDAA